MEKGLLIDKISTEKNLHSAWKKLNKYNSHSHGMSGVTIEVFKSNLDEHIELISKKLKSNSYKFSPNRAVAILKSNGSYRPLQVPEIQDRLVLKAIAIELEEQFAEVIQLSDGLSFAYQKRLGMRDAIDKMRELYNQGKTIILEADIINFFGEVNKDKLLNEYIFPKLPDSSLNDLILSGLNQDIKGLELLNPLQLEKFKNIKNGIPQGNPLSPLLSNIYLSPFDLHLKEKHYGLIRYADDFIVMCENKEIAEKCYQDCFNFLEKELSLKVHDILLNEKTKIVDPKIERFIFLSIEFNGKQAFPSIEKYEKLKNKIRSICNSNINEMNVLALITKIRNGTDGWISAFFYTDMDKYIEDLDYFINRQLFLSLRKFDWRLSNSSLGKLPNKFRQKGESSDCLSINQRINSGIPTCRKMLDDKRKNDEITPPN